MLRFLCLRAAAAFTPMIRRIIRPILGILMRKFTNRRSGRCRFTNRTRMRLFALCGAGGRFRLFAFIPSMLARSRDFFIRRIIAPYSFTGRISFPADFRAGGRLRIMHLNIVQQRVYAFRISRRFAYSTSKRFYTRCIASRLRGDFTVIPNMYVRNRNDFLRHNHRTAIRTMTARSQARCVAGRLYIFVHHHRMIAYAIASALTVGTAVCRLITVVACAVLVGREIFTLLHAVACIGLWNPHIAPCQSKHTRHGAQRRQQSYPPFFLFHIMPPFSYQ